VKVSSVVSVAISMHPALDIPNMLRPQIRREKKSQTLQLS